MGKSNNLHNNFKKFYQRENNLNNFLKENEIQILENINNSFINQFIIDFSDFIKNKIKLISYSMKIKSYNFNRNSIKNFRYLNLIEISPYKQPSILIFSYNFLSVMIDLLFGGRGNSTDSTKIQKIDITSTEILINKKIIQFINNNFSRFFQEYFSSEIKLININKLVDFKKTNFDLNKIFLINYFNFNINNIEVFFNFLIPLSIVKKINKNIIAPIKSDNNIHTEKNSENIISFNDIYDIELNIVVKIIDISISRDKFNNLLVGDILSIKKPDKIIGCIEKKPIFFGNYKRFNEQSIVFIEEFINNNLESNQNKEYSSE